MLGNQTVSSGAGADFTFTPGDEGAYIVTLQVTDTEDGKFSTTQTTVTANDVPPTVAPLPAMAVNEGDPVTLTGSYTDPGTVDTQTLTWHVSSTNGQVIPDGHGLTFRSLPMTTAFIRYVHRADTDGGPLIGQLP